ncbi:Variant-specific surface protein [Giardia duodenalis]|uniref:Variant-specific surface protein n=1 Tax=Giardia intestinalis TaxID=5741 RepID=V6U4F5_GIAIN|nr:Variant-specific surface protein [Giardia intestinalis]
MCIYHYERAVWTISALLAICFAVGALAAACGTGTAATNCDSDNCEMVGTTQICTSCQAGYVPINGKCTAVASAANCKKTAGGDLTDQDKTCGKCEGTTFMYKGGCYDKEGEIGRVICKTPGTTPGVCQACADGYFKESGASATAASCTKCGDENCATCTVGTTANKCTKCVEGYFVGAAGSTEGACVACGDAVTGSNGFKGVDGCAKCTKPDDSSSPATCTECNTNYLKTESAGATSCVTAENCGEGFFATAVNNIKKCVSCSDKTNGVDGCEKCTAPGEGKTKPACTKCSGSNYLKTVDGATTCVIKGDCNGGYFPNDSVDSKKQCILCNKATTGGIDGCTECALLSSPSRAVLITCSACVSGKKPNTDGSQCIACDIDGCARCSEASKCSQCGDGHRLEGETCVRTSTIAGMSVTKSLSALRC